LLPELLAERPGIPAPGPLTESWQRQRFFQALARPFATYRQLLLLMDDVQWCDGETLEWLPFLVRSQVTRERRGGRATHQATRLLLVVTMRTEERPEGARLETLLGELRRSRQLSEIELGPLDEVETFSLATSVAGRALDPALADPLFRGSEGNPLFVVEMVRAGGGVASSQQLAEHAREKDRVDLPLPPKVQQVIEARLAQLSPSARELAGAAATIGREFTFEVLARAHGEGEEASVRSLDELWRRRIVREQGADAYDFAHDRIREVAYAGMSAARRRFLHRRAAEALEAVYAADLEAVAGQVAAHYEQAGQVEQAIPHYERAAEAAGRIYANQEVVDHLRRAIGLLQTIDDESVQAARLHQRLGGVLALMGNHEEAHRAYEVAIGLAPSSHSLWRARLQCEIGNTWRSRQRFQEAGAAYDAAIRLLDSESVGSDPKWWQAWLDIQLARADMLYFASKLSALAALCRELEGVVTAHGSAKQQANFYHALVMLDNRRSRFRPPAETLRHSANSLELARETGDQQLVDHSTFGFGFSLLWFGDLEAAEEQFMTALAQAKRTGNVPLQDRCLAYLSIARRFQGDEGQVRTYAEQGLGIATTEQNPFYLGVAWANLAWLSFRDGNIDEVLRDGPVALEQWRPYPYPFAWLAHWPLLAVHLSQGQMRQALDHARAMLDPSQQRPPETLEALLEEAAQTWDEGQAKSARECLKQAMDLAGEMGYL
jgi:tetratricopeptide (TPR) repeat protein